MEASRALQRQADWAAEKILVLENQLKANTLKLRVFPEGAEEPTETRAFVSSWLALQLHLEEGGAPLLDAAYCIGPPRKTRNTLPRDILIRCSDQCTWQKILVTARAKGHLQFEKEDILVLQDLSVETLDARRRLKLLMALLNKYCN